MLRQARINAPGALHHIIACGIERRKIFYYDFVESALAKAQERLRNWV